MYWFNFDQPLRRATLLAVDRVCTVINLNVIAQHPNKISFRLFTNIDLFLFFQTAREYKITCT